MVHGAVDDEDLRRALAEESDKTSRRERLQRTLRRLVDAQGKLAKYA